MEYTSYMYEVTKEQTQSFLKKLKLKNKKPLKEEKKVKFLSSSFPVSGTGC